MTIYLTLIYLTLSAEDLFPMFKAKSKSKEEKKKLRAKHRLRDAHLWLCLESVTQVTRTRLPTRSKAIMAINRELSRISY